MAGIWLAVTAIKDSSSPIIRDFFAVELFHASFQHKVGNRFSTIATQPLVHRRPEFGSGLCSNQFLSGGSITHALFLTPFKTFHKKTLDRFRK